MYNYVCLLAVRTFIIIISCKLFAQTLHWLWLSITIFISFSDLRRELHPLSFILSFPWDERKESFRHTHTHTSDLSDGNKADVTLPPPPFLLLLLRTVKAVYVCVCAIKRERSFNLFPFFVWCTAHSFLFGDEDQKATRSIFVFEPDWKKKGLRHRWWWWTYNRIKRSCWWWVGKKDNDTHSNTTKWKGLTV